KVGADGCRIADETVFRLVEPVQPSAPGPYPNITHAVLDDRRDEIAAQAGSIIGNILVDIEVIAIVMIQAVPCPEPHKTLLVAQDTGDIVLGKPRLGSDMGKFQIAWLRNGENAGEQQQKKKRILDKLHGC